MLKNHTNHLDCACVRVCVCVVQVRKVSDNGANWNDVSRCNNCDDDEIFRTMIKMFPFISTRRVIVETFPMEFFFEQHRFSQLTNKPAQLTFVCIHTISFHYAINKLHVSN